MWSLELPYRRYSVPETVMRKFRLRQSSSSSSDNSARRTSRRPVARARHAGRSRYCTNTTSKGVQTSPPSNHCSESRSKENCLLSKQHGQAQRSNSVPDLSSDAEIRENHRPLSAKDKVIKLYDKQTSTGRPVIISPEGTPSPTRASNFSSTYHRCDVYSNSWSYTTSSEYTLGQSVSDRTTSTQDSTLSIQSSTTPESSTSTSLTPDRTAQRMYLENNIFTPAGNFIAVHTESLLIHPIDIVESRQNWNFGFSDSPESDTLIALPGYHRSVAINTEPPETYSAPMVDKSTCAYGMFNDKSAQVRDSDLENELTFDKSTYIAMLNGNLNSGTEEAEQTKELIEEKLVYVDAGINTDQQPAYLDDQSSGGGVGVANYAEVSLTDRKAVFKIPHIKIFKGSTNESQEDRSFEEAKVYATKSTSVDENVFRNVEASQPSGRICKHCGREVLSDNGQNDEEELKHLWHMKSKPVSYEKRLCADVACTGCNYKDYPPTDGVIARFSAVPRSNSMLVNTSSIDYSSDSDLSLTDSLEDGNDHHNIDQYQRPVTRHDNRLVRGEVSLDQQQQNSKKYYPKGNKAYAYFLSITGEQDMVRHCPLPDWLKVRLQRREEEIKKLFQVRLNKHQTIIYRRRKKTLKRLPENEDSNSSANKEKEKRLKGKVTNLKRDEINKESENTLELPETKETASTSSVFEQAPKETILISDDHDNNNVTSKDETGRKLEPIASEGRAIQQTKDDNNYVHISEVIKIEMMNSLNTIITKEKQINVNQNSLSNRNMVQTSEFIKNEKSLNAQNIIMKTNIGNFQIDNNNTEIQDGTEPLKIKEVIQTSVSKEKSNTIPSKKSNEVHRSGDKVTDAKKSRSFKQFRPLFQSKADDQSVAQILLSAMENNGSSVKTNKVIQSATKTSQGETKSELEKSNLQEECRNENKEVSYLDTKDQPNVRIEKSCNTFTPYLSTFVQTDTSFLKEKNVSKIDISEIDKGNIPDSKKEDIPIKYNRDVPDMMSSSVQTTETFLINERTFIESENLIFNRDQGTDAFQESPKFEMEDLNKNVPFNVINELVSVFVQTEQNAASINEVRPLIIHSNTEELKGLTQSDERDFKNYTSNRKQFTNIPEKSRRQYKSDWSRQYSKDEHLKSHEHKSCQVLELNNPPCSCHMCTLSKKVSSRNEKQNEGFHTVPMTSSGKRKKQQYIRTTPVDKEEKKPYQKFHGNRRTNNYVNKFQRRFEVIPEEKNSSTESIGEVQKTPLEFSKEKKMLGRNIDTSKMNFFEESTTNAFKSKFENMTEEMRRTTEQGGDNIVCSSEVKSTQTNGSKKSNVVFGRFKAVKNDPKNKSEGKFLGEGIEVMQQYKGRAALATAHVDGQEQLLTLSKGWINFYLLKDSQEFSDSNNDEGQRILNDGLVQRGVSPIRILKGSEVQEEQIEEFTVEIRATPEPLHPADKSILLPNLHQTEMKKHKTIKSQTQSSTICLPDIHTSSSSSTPENEKFEPVEGKSKKSHPLPVVNGRRKSSRREIRMQRESVTSFEKIPKPEPLLRLAEEFTSNFDKGHSTKAVEVALSEHSVSSITSSTIILSESPSPKHERKSRHRQHSYHEGQLIQQRASQFERNNGSSWTVTVAGTSGNNNHSPPDVEMRLTFGNKQPSGDTAHDDNEKGLVQFNSKKSSRTTSTSKKKGRMIEEYAHSSKNEKNSLQYNMPTIALKGSQGSKAELSHGSLKEIANYFDQDNSSQLSRRSKGSVEGSSDVTSLCSDLQVTGLAITPESKPRVPTQSERDLVRRQRYKFTR